MATEPQNFSGQFSTEAAENAKEMKDSAVESAENVKEATAHVGRRAFEKIDEQRLSSARALESTAAALHRGAASFPIRKAANAAHSAADKLEATASYMRRNTLRDMVDDLGDFVRHYPAQTLAVAAIAGFLVGRAFRKD